MKVFVMEVLKFQFCDVNYDEKDMTCCVVCELHE